MRRDVQSDDDDSSDLPMDRGVQSDDDDGSISRGTDRIREDPYDGDGEIFRNGIKQVWISPFDLCAYGERRSFRECLRFPHAPEDHVLWPVPDELYRVLRAKGLCEKSSGGYPYCAPKYAGKPLPTPNTAYITFADPRDQRNSRRHIGVCAFYHPGVDEEWDKQCGAGFCGNFWDCGENAIEVTARTLFKGKKITVGFSNAEAAFQSLKFWATHALAFGPLSGGQAFKLKKELTGNEDWEYGGFGGNWQGMYECLKAKFLTAGMRPLAEALAATGDAYLLEHNTSVGRDLIWSDNHLGEGTNWLGLQCMLIRDQLNKKSGPGSWTYFATHACGIDVTTGKKRGDGSVWQNTVRDACGATTAKFTPHSCQAKCGKPTYNGKPNEYCSRSCAKSAVAEKAVAESAVVKSDAAGGGFVVTLNKDGYHNVYLRGRGNVITVPNGRVFKVEHRYTRDGGIVEVMDGEGGRWIIKERNTDKIFKFVVTGNRDEHPNVYLRGLDGNGNIYVDNGKELAVTGMTDDGFEVVYAGARYTVKKHNTMDDKAAVWPHALNWPSPQVNLQAKVAGGRGLFGLFPL
jgi:hypothetical protein